MRFVSYFYRMRLATIQPREALRAYVSKFVISEQPEALSYRVFPSAGLVAGFQFSGGLTIVRGGVAEKLSLAGVTGLGDVPRSFANMPGTGTILIYFTETGFSYFTRLPVHELFNQSVPLAELFKPGQIAMVQEQLHEARTDPARVSVVENFLLAQVREIAKDRMVVEAVRLIHECKGHIRIGDLHQKLHTSASPLEKRFRGIVGTSPKKFASVIRFHAALAEMGSGKSLTDICYDNHFFDQAHFTKDFTRFAGQTPDEFIRADK
jgi:AraC-like DNA-binding protein